MSSQPCLRALYYIHAPALDSSPSRFRVRFFGKIVVKLKTSIEPGRQILAVQNDRPKECRRSVALLLEQFRQRRMIHRQRHAKVAHSMRAWQQSGENTCVRCIRNRTGRKCLGEANSLFCKVIERRGPNPLVTIAMDVVASQRVDRDEKNVWARRLFSLSLPSNRSHGGQKPAWDESRDPHGVFEGSTRNPCRTRCISLPVPACPSEIFQSSRFTMAPLSFALTQLSVVSESNRWAREPRRDPAGSRVE